MKYLESNSKNFDIVHAHSYHAFPALYASQSKRGNRLVFTAHYHGTGHTFFRAMLHRPYKMIGRGIFKKADKIICVSKYEKCLILKNFQINEEKMTIIPNGVDTAEFSSFKKNDRGYRFILYVGRLDKSKGVHHLIKAVPKIDPDIILEIVGDGPFGRTLTRLAEEYGVKDRVVFRKNLDRQTLLQEYVDASLFVSLSKYESYGITIAEALTSGVPCLVANSTALTEWIDNKCCFGIDFPINTDDLAARINENIGKKINKPNLPNWNDIAKLIIKTYDGLF
jgi:glycosyltransferase involved in cell wall biosynthesis